MKRNDTILLAFFIVLFISGCIRNEGDWVQGICRAKTPEQRRQNIEDLTDSTFNPPTGVVMVLEGDILFGIDGETESDNSLHMQAEKARNMRDLSDSSEYTGEMIVFQKEKMNYIKVPKDETLFLLGLIRTAYREGPMFTLFPHDPKIPHRSYEIYNKKRLYFIKV